MGTTEILDIYNGQGQLVGSKERDLVHKDGDWHKTFHCWIIFRDSLNTDYVVLQKRSDNKKSWPGYVDISAAGHITSGEKVEDGLRELEEELGVVIDFKNLINAGIRVCIEDFKVGTSNHEFQHVFFLIDNRELNKYKIQGEELSGILIAKIDDLLGLFSKEIDSVNSQGFIVSNQNNIIQTEYLITRDKFIPTLDNYYYKVMILAKRILNNEKHIHI